MWPLQHRHIPSIYIHRMNVASLNIIVLGDDIIPCHEVLLGFKLQYHKPGMHVCTCTRLSGHNGHSIVSVFTLVGGRDPPLGAALVVAESSKAAKTSSVTGLEEPPPPPPPPPPSLAELTDFWLPLEGSCSLGGWAGESPGVACGEGV